MMIVKTSGVSFVGIILLIISPFKAQDDDCRESVGELIVSENPVVVEEPRPKLKVTSLRIREDRYLGSLTCHVLKDSNESYYSHFSTESSNTEYSVSSYDVFRYGKPLHPKRYYDCDIILEETEGLPESTLEIDLDVVLILQPLFLNSGASNPCTNPIISRKTVRIILLDSTDLKNRTTTGGSLPSLVTSIPESSTTLPTTITTIPILSYITSFSDKTSTTTDTFAITSFSNAPDPTTFQAALTSTSSPTSATTKRDKKTILLGGVLFQSAEISSPVDEGKMKPSPGDGSKEISESSEIPDSDDKINPFLDDESKKVPEISDPVDENSNGPSILNGSKDISGSADTSDPIDDDKTGPFSGDGSKGALEPAEEPEPESPNGVKEEESKASDENTVEGEDDEPQTLLWILIIMGILLGFLFLASFIYYCCPNICFCLFSDCVNRVKSTSTSQNDLTFVSVRDKEGRILSSASTIDILKRNNVKTYPIRAENELEKRQWGDSISPNPPLLHTPSLISNSGPMSPSSPFPIPNDSSQQPNLFFRRLPPNDSESLVLLRRTHLLNDEESEEKKPVIVRMLRAISPKTPRHLDSQISEVPPESSQESVRKIKSDSIVGSTFPQPIYLRDPPMRSEIFKIPKEEEAPVQREAIIKTSIEEEEPVQREAVIKTSIEEEPSPSKSLPPVEDDIISLAEDDGTLTDSLDSSIHRSPSSDQSRNDEASSKSGEEDKVYEDIGYLSNAMQQLIKNELRSKIMSSSDSEDSETDYSTSTRVFCAEISASSDPEINEEFAESYFRPLSPPKVLPSPTYYNETKASILRRRSNNKISAQIPSLRRISSSMTELNKIEEISKPGRRRKDEDSISVTNL